MLTALAPAMGMTFETLQIPIGDTDRVRGYLMLPRGAEPVPTVLVSNGLEGTLAKALFPLLAGTVPGGSDPGVRTSTATARPRASSSAHTALPRYPLPPVTSIMGLP
jgi:hypothetical protein